MQGITELKIGQQQLGEAVAAGRADVRADLQGMRASVNAQGHIASIQSEELMRRVQEYFSKTTNSSTAQQHETKCMITEIKKELHSISNRLNGVSSMTGEQMSMLQTLIGTMSDMQLRTPTDFPNLGNNTPNQADFTLDNRNNESMPSNSDIERLLNKIRHLAGKIATHGYSKDAQVVIEDIGRLLGLVMEQASVAIPDHNELPRKRKVLCDYDYSKIETEVQSMEQLVKAKRILTASERVSISNLGRSSH